jgi:arylsulfatase A-like enzyme
MARRPNFLCLVADQFRHDLLGCAGRRVVRTPHLDRLAAEGVRFDRCYSVHPLCMATRATWFTGLTPRAHGVRCNGVPLDPRIPTLGAALAGAGYRTHGVGKIHLKPFFPQTSLDAATLRPEDWPEAMPLWNDGRLTRLPAPYYGLQTVDFHGGNGHRAYGHYMNWLLERETRGREMLAPPPGVEMNFERAVEVAWTCRLPEELHITAWAAERAERFLAEASATGQPFFLWVSVPEPHPPYMAPAPWAGLYDPTDMPEPNRRAGELDSLPPHYRRLFETGLPTAGRIAPTNVPEEARRRVTAMVYGMVGQFDAMVGRILAALEARGLADDTAVVFMSDHGQMLGDHWMYSMPPSHLDGNLRVPSVWRWPSGFQRGVVSNALVSHLDFAPTVLDLAGVPIPAGRVPPAAEAPLQRRPWPGRSLRPILASSQAEAQDSVIAENDEDYLGMRMRTLITPDHHITVYAGECYGELYDLRSDPRQVVNLWDDPGAQSLKRDLQARLLDRMAETDDVLPRRMGHA